MQNREGNGTSFRHSEAVTDVTAVGIFFPVLKKGGTSSEIATPVCALVRNDRERVCALVRNDEGRGCAYPFAMTKKVRDVCSF